MNLRMTVLARPAHGELRIHSGSHPMGYRVALIAEPRPRHFQHVLVDRAVRVVAVQAILAHRRVLEQERPALFGMTLVASVIDRIGAQHRLGEAAMRIMAIRAGDLAFSDRHVCRPQNLSTLILMALEAGVGLEWCFQREACRHVRHNRVTIATGDAALFMHAALPIGSLAALVAVQTDRVVLLDGPARIVGPERNDAADAESTNRR